MSEGNFFKFSQESERYIKRYNVEITRDKTMGVENTAMLDKMLLFDGMVTGSKNGVLDHSEIVALYENAKRFSKNGVFDEDSAKQYIENFLVGTDISPKELVSILRSIVGSVKIGVDMHNVPYASEEEKEIKNYVVEHFSQTVDEEYSKLRRFEDTSGDIIKVGTAISDYVKEAINGKSNKTYAELDRDIKKQRSLASDVKQSLMIEPNSPYALAHPEEADFNGKFNAIGGREFTIEDADRFMSVASEYQTITSMKQKTEMLDDSIKQVKRLYEREQNQKYQQGIQVSMDKEESPRDVLMNSLIDYFGDRESAAVFLSGLTEGLENSSDFTAPKIMEILKEIRNLTESRYEQSLKGRSYNSIKENYKNQYESFYGVPNLNDEIDTVMGDGQVVGSTMEMGVVIATSILMGGSNLVAGGAQALAKRLGPKAAQQLVKLGMTSMTVLENAGLQMLDASSSNAGLNSSQFTQILEGQKESLPYIFFGAYVSGPVGDKVKGLWERVSSLGTSTVSFASEVGLDVAFEELCRGGEFSNVFGENARGEAFGRFMNMIMGGRAHGASKAAMQNAQSIMEGYRFKLVENDDGSKSYIVTDVTTGKGQRIDKPEDFMVALAVTALARSGVEVESSTVKTQDKDTGDKVPKKTGSIESLDLSDKLRSLIKEDKKVTSPKSQEDVETEKKPYERPETQRKSLVTEDDIMDVAPQKESPIAAAMRKRKNEIRQRTVQEQQDKVKEELDIAREKIDKSNNENLKQFFEELSNKTLLPEEIKQLGNLADIKDAEILNHILKENSGKDPADINFYQIRDLSNVDQCLRTEKPVNSEGNLKKAINKAQELGVDIDTELYNFKQDARLEGLKTFIEKNPSSQLSKDLYDKHYLSDKSPEVQKLSKEILDKYGVYTFVRNIDDVEPLKQSLQELEEIYVASEGKANYPARLDFSEYNEHFIDKSAGGISSGNSVWVIPGKLGTLRHELIHQNDKYNSPMGDGCNYEHLDEVLSGKYKDEFRKAGIDEKSIEYAHTSRADYLAVLAGQGDLTKVSPEFKKLLIDELGMPEWAFDLKPLQIVTDLSNTAKLLTEGQTFIKDFEGYGKIEVTKYDGNKFDYRIIDKTVNEKENLKLEPYTSEELVAKYPNRFTSGALNTIKNLYANYPDEVEFINKLIDAKYISGGKEISRIEFDVEFENAIKLKQQNEEVFDLVFNSTIKDNSGNDIPQFETIDQIGKVMELQKQNPENFDFIFNAKIKDENGNEVPRFKGYSDIKEAMELRQNYPESFNVIFNATVNDGNGNVVPRYSSSYLIKMAIDVREQNPNAFDWLSNMTFKNPRGIEMPIFGTTTDVGKAMLLHEENPESFYMMLFSTIKGLDNTDKPRFDSIYEIQKAMELREQDPEGFDEVFNLTYKDKNGNDYIRFETVDTIEEAMKLRKENPKEYKLKYDIEYRKEHSSVSAKINTEEIASDNGSEKYTVTTQYNDFNSKVFDEMVSSKREIKDKNGKLLYKEYYFLTEEGKYDIVREDAQGNTKIIGMASKQLYDDWTILERTLIAEDGTRTVYSASENGSTRIVDLKIMDNEGNLKANSVTRFEKIDDNHFESYENGVAYDIEYKQDKVVVTRDDGEKVELSVGGEKGIIESSLLDLCKQLPGSIYFDMKNCRLQGILLNEPLGHDNAQYDYISRIVSVSRGLNSPEQIYTLMHEFGHMIDFSSKNPINKNPELIEMFKEEYNKIPSQHEKDAIAYYTDEAGNGISEVIADVHALLYGNNHWNVIEERALYLQQYFPKTFAKVVELLNQAKIDMANQPLDKVDNATENKFVGAIEAENAKKTNMIHADDIVKPESNEPVSVVHRPLSEGLKNRIATEFNGDESKIELFKVLYDIDNIHPKNKFDNKQLDPNDLIKIVNEYSEEEILTIKTLLGNNANKNSMTLNVKWLASVSPIHIHDLLGKLKQFIEVAKDNSELLKGFDIMKVKNNTRFKAIMKVISEEPSIKPDDFYKKVDIETDKNIIKEAEESAALRYKDNSEKLKQFNGLLEAVKQKTIPLLPTQLELYKIIDNYSSEDIETIRILLANNATYPTNGTSSEVTPFLFSSNDAKKMHFKLQQMQRYIDVVKDNPELMKKLTLAITSSPIKYNSTMQIVSENPNIKFDDLAGKVSQRIIDFENELEETRINNIENPILKSFAEKNYDTVMSLDLLSLDKKIKSVDDFEVEFEVTSLLNEFKASNNPTLLLKINDILDVYHTFNNHYEYIGEVGEKTEKRQYLDNFKEPFRKKIYTNAVMKEQGRFWNYYNDSKASGIVKDFADEAKLERLRNFCENNPNDPMATYFYNEYYLKKAQIPKDLSVMCDNINKEFNTKIFLTHDDIMAAPAALHFIYDELSAWKEASGGTAKYPPILDLSKIKQDYIDKTAAYGQGTAAALAYPDTSKKIEVNGYSSVVRALRHEMTHINDLKRGCSIPSQYSLKDIMPKKSENGILIPDFENCKFQEEFLNAGVKPSDISYAYNNVEEFIAVAAEGDMSKYSPQFKQMLVDFGMPEWMFKMEVNDLQIKERLNDIELMKKYTNINDCTNFIRRLATYENLKGIVNSTVEKHSDLNLPNNPELVLKSFIDLNQHSHRTVHVDEKIIIEILTGQFDISKYL